LINASRIKSLETEAMTLEKEQFCEIFPFFRTVPNALVNDILSSCRCQTAPANLVLKEEGDEISEFVLLLSGEKRVYKTNSNDREITLYEMGAGDICLLNVCCLLSNSRLPANAASLTKVEMLLMAAADFLYIMNRYEEMRTFIFRRLADGFTSAISLITEVTFGKLDERLNNYLVEKSENGKLSTTHQKIANDLGTSREVISRMLKHYQQKGDIRLSRNYIELTRL